MFYVQQIFLDVGLGQLADWPTYGPNMEAVRSMYGRDNHRLWTDNDVMKLFDRSYPHLKPFVERLPGDDHLAGFSVATLVAARLPC